ncbi:hypothetical protein [Streptomyces sp. LN785]
MRFDRVEGGSPCGAPLSEAWLVTIGLALARRHGETLDLLTPVLGVSVE